jgi:NADH-quinone oxidoreductase subunit A
MFLLAESPSNSWAPVVLLILIGIAFTVGTLVASAIVGPARSGPGKDSTYESGMVPVGDTRRRFNVRFYVLAMIFLVFDVGIILFYPWASIFGTYAHSGAFSDAAGMSFGSLLLLEAAVLLAILLTAYLYALGKGVFKFE